jgi:hypothetical protein
MTAAAPASTVAVAQELVSLCRQGRNLDAVNRLYSPRIVSIESVGSPEMPAEMTGIDAIRRKHEWWYENNEVHSGGSERAIHGRESVCRPAHVRNHVQAHRRAETVHGDGVVHGREREDCAGALLL